jgi:hypothetical protein
MNFSTYFRILLFSSHFYHMTTRQYMSNNNIFFSVVWKEVWELSWNCKKICCFVMTICVFKLKGCEDYFLMCLYFRHEIKNFSFKFTTILVSLFRCSNLLTTKKIKKKVEIFITDDQSSQGEEEKKCSWDK